MTMTSPIPPEIRLEVYRKALEIMESCGRPADLSGLDCVYEASCHLKKWRSYGKMIDAFPELNEYRLLVGLGYTDYQKMILREITAELEASLPHPNIEERN